MKNFFSIRFCMSAVAIIVCLSTLSCKKPANNPATGGSGDANVVTGIAADAQNRPLAGIKVRAENPTGDNIHVDATTGADGRYKMKLSSIGGWKIYAWKEVEYKAKVYHLRLAMKSDTDYDAFATNGKSVVKDFVCKLNGRIPDRPASAENGSGYFGASLRIVNSNDVVPVILAGTKVTVTLTPVDGATYLDGSPAKAVVVKTFTIQNGNANYYFYDVPVTEYRVTAKSEINNVFRKVYVGANSSSDLLDWVEFYFDPAPSSNGSYESGLKSPNDFPFYLAQGTERV